MYAGTAEPPFFFCSRSRKLSCTTRSSARGTPARVQAAYAASSFLHAAHPWVIPLRTVLGKIPPHNAKRVCFAILTVHITSAFSFSQVWYEVTMHAQKQSIPL